MKDRPLAGWSNLEDQLLADAGEGLGGGGDGTAYDHLYMQHSYLYSIVK